MNTKLNREGKALFDAICGLPVDQIMAIKQALDDLGDEVGFRTWLVEVDACMERLIPMTHADLPDQPYRDWFDSGLPSSDVATMALEDSGYKVEKFYEKCSSWT